jgi:acyl carrier protein
MGTKAKPLAPCCRRLCYLWARSGFSRISYKHPAIDSETPRAGEQMGETMDARVAPPRHTDADKVRSFIAEYVGIDAKEVTDETHLTDDLGLDWLDQLELMVLIEDEFVGVDFFANTTATQMELVGDLIRQIEYHKAAPVRRSAA